MNSRTLLCKLSFVTAAVLCVCPTTVHADNQYNLFFLACCGSNCGSTNCNLDGHVYLTQNSPTCSPNCFITAILEQDDSGCTIDTNTLRFVRESSPCVEDVGDPFNFPFPINTPFLVTNSELNDILDVNTKVKAATNEAAVSVSGTLAKKSSQSSVPAASTWGLLLLGLTVLAGGSLVIRQGHRLSNTNE